MLYVYAAIPRHVPEPVIRQLQIMFVEGKLLQ